MGHRWSWNVVDAGWQSSFMGLAARHLSAPTVMYTDLPHPNPLQFIWIVDSGPDLGWVVGGTITKFAAHFPYGYAAVVEPDVPV